MRQNVAKCLLAVLSLSLFWVIASETCAAPQIPVITKDDLKGMLDDPGVIIIDVRVEGAWKSSDRKIKGAMWEDPGSVDAWAGKYSKDKTIVLYCS